MANTNLANAKNAKNDEFYTQYPDIQKEMNAYVDYNPNVFRDKCIFLPCDEPCVRHIKSRRTKRKPKAKVTVPIVLSVMMPTAPASGNLTRWMPTTSQLGVKAEVLTLTIAKCSVRRTIGQKETDN